VLPAQWKHKRHGRAAEGAGYRPGTGSIKIAVRRVMRYTGTTCGLASQPPALIEALTPTSSAQGIQQTGC
jgi:hypothetical protein